MQSRILTLFARTPVHVGAGNSVGAVDSPVMRERHTRIPIIPGSSLKGVLRDLWASDADQCQWLFGNEQNAGKDEFRAGALLVGEARVLAFPVRCAKGGFAWITCPLALARFKRDAALNFVIPDGLDETRCLASKEITLGDTVVLEEYCLNSTGESDTWTALADIADDEVWKDLGRRFVVVADEMFTYFAEHACEVVTRVRIDDATGTVANGALFNQENVPSETLFYAVIAAQDEKRAANGKRKTEEADAPAKRSAEAALDALQARLDAAKVIQVGGDETIGLGYCSVKLA